MNMLVYWYIQLSGLLSPESILVPAKGQGLVMSIRKIQGWVVGAPLCWAIPVRVCIRPI